MEAHFMAHGVDNEFNNYCTVVGAFPHDSLHYVANIVKMLPNLAPSKIIKQRLLGTHQRFDHERTENLYIMPANG
jgi:hypothetical protein